MSYVQNKKEKCEDMPSDVWDTMKTILLSG